jgi:hypothetical protein
MCSIYIEVHLRSETIALDNRVYEPIGLRGVSLIGFRGHHPNRQHLTRSDEEQGICTCFRDNSEMEAKFSPVRPSLQR